MWFARTTAGAPWAALAVFLSALGCSGASRDSVAGPEEAVGGVISGRVMVAGATPETAIAGALVGTSPATGIAFTDAEGRFEIRGVPVRGSVTYHVTAVKEGFVAASAPVTLSESTPTGTADLQLDIAFRGTFPKGIGNLSVLVTREDGSPIHAVVTIRRVGIPSAPGLSITTDESGRAQFPNITSGTYHVEAEASLLGVSFFGSTGAQVELNRVTFVHLIVHRVF